MTTNSKSCSRCLKPPPQAGIGQDPHAGNTVVKRAHCGIILIDSDLPGGWKIFLQDVQARAHPPALIVVARVGDKRLWAEVLNLGGYDVLAKPLDPAEVDYVISAACRQMGGGPITPDAMPVSQCWALEADPHE